MTAPPRRWLYRRLRLGSVGYALFDCIEGTPYTGGSTTGKSETDRRGPDEFPTVKSEPSWASWSTVETFESSPEDRLQHSGETNADCVMRFLTAHPGQAFTQSEIRDATDVKAGSISVVLSRLEDRGLVRHKGNYWALGESDGVAAYASGTLRTNACGD